MNRLARAAVFCAIITAVFVGTFPATINAQPAADVSAHPWIGKAAPVFKLAKVGGGELGLEDLEGKYVVIHFGTSW